MKATKKRIFGLGAALAPFAVVALLAGCDREEPPAAAPSAPAPAVEPAKSAVSPTSPKAMMENPAMQATLKAARSSRNALAKELSETQTRLMAKVDAARERLPLADEAALKAELEKDSEYVSLSARCAELVKAIEADRRHTTDKVRDVLKTIE